MYKKLVLVMMFLTCGLLYAQEYKENGVAKIISISDEDKDKHFSFNVPGSPDWNKEDPFKKFEDMAISDEVLKKIDYDIESFIEDRCGVYYTSIKKGEQGFHLTAEYMGETVAEREERKNQAREYNKKRIERVERAVREAKNNLPKLQKKWKEKRKNIKGECRTYIMKKYAFEISTEKLEEMLNTGFASTEKFKGVYYVPYNPKN